MAWTPVPGKASTMTSNAATIKHGKAELRIRCRAYKRSVFSETADSDGNYWERTGAGLCGFTFTSSGPFNSESTNTQFTTGASKASLRPGLGSALTSGTFVLSSGITFTIPGVISENNVMADVEAGVDIAYTLEGDGALTYPT